MVVDGLRDEWPQKAQLELAVYPDIGPGQHLIPEARLALAAQAVLVATTAASAQFFR